MEYIPRKSKYHYDESVLVKNEDLVEEIAALLRVQKDTLINALTTKRAKVQGEMLIMNYKCQEVGRS